MAGERGTMLAELLIVVTVFSVLGTAVLGAVQTSHIARGQFASQSTAENLIRTQLESVLEQAYKAPDDPDPTYLLVTPPAGYSVTAESLTYDVTSADISTVRISVYQDGQLVKVFETLRGNR